ncbi:hypothetical protein U1Q18_042804, partial [Sarracenia purpurea var. burkii]
VGGSQVIGALSAAATSGDWQLGGDVASNSCEGEARLPVASTRHGKRRRARGHKEAERRPRVRALQSLCRAASRWSSRQKSKRRLRNQQRNRKQGHNGETISEEGFTEGIATEINWNYSSKEEFRRT